MRNKKMSGLMVLSAALLIIGFVFADGCEKKSSPAPSPADPTSGTQSPAPATAAVAEQTICPVMGGPINKDIFVEYQGKKVYFCCAQCKGQFEKEPQKYLSKLPQFAK
jgi:YHS domain-containing protein